MKKNVLKNISQICFCTKYDITYLLEVCKVIRISLSFLTRSIIAKFSNLPTCKYNHITTLFCFPQIKSKPCVISRNFISCSYARLNNNIFVGAIKPTKFAGRFKHSLILFILHNDMRNKILFMVLFD